MEEMHRARYVGRFLELLSVLQACCLLQHPDTFTNLKTLQILSFKDFNGGFITQMWLMAIGEQCQFQLVSPPQRSGVGLKVLTLFSGWFLWQPVYTLQVSLNWHKLRYSERDSWRISKTLFSLLALKKLQRFRTRCQEQAQRSNITTWKVRKLKFQAVQWLVQIHVGWT